jgi:hypothetical protein
LFGLFSLFAGNAAVPGAVGGFGAGLRYAKGFSRVLRKVIGLAWAGRDWRGAAFGAAGRDAVKMDKEAHMFERSEFVRFPFSRRLFREPRSGSDAAAPRQSRPAQASPITHYIPKSVSMSM